MDGFAERLHLYWTGEVDGIEDSIVSSHRKVALTPLLKIWKEKQSNQTDFPRVTALHTHGVQEGRMNQEMKRKEPPKPCSGPVPGAPARHPVVVAECWEPRGAHVLGLLLLPSSVCADPSLPLSFPAPGGAGGHC